MRSTTLTFKQPDFAGRSYQTHSSTCRCRRLRAREIDLHSAKCVKHTSNYAATFRTSNLETRGNLHTLSSNYEDVRLFKAEPPMRSIRRRISAIFPLLLGVRKTVKSSTAVVVPMIDQSGHIGSLKLHSEVLRRNLPELCQKRSSEKPLNMPLAIDFLMNSALPPITVTQRPFNGFVSGTKPGARSLVSQGKGPKTASSSCQHGRTHSLSVKTSSSILGKGR